MLISPVPLFVLIPRHTRQLACNRASVRSRILHLTFHMALRLNAVAAAWELSRIPIPGALRK